MTFEAISNYSDLLNLMVYETPNYHQYVYDIGTMESSCVVEKPQYVKGGNKRKRRPDVYGNKEEAETQRITHIAVERNRRKLMNAHLNVLRSLMPESFVRRGDQASIVGGAIEFVKHLQHVVQSIEVHKLLLLKQPENPNSGHINTLASQIAELVSYPQNSSYEVGCKYTLKSIDEGAHIEVTLIETHANLRIISKKSTNQLSKMVSGFQKLCLSILHLNVTTLDPFVLYSVSAKVEEGCQLTCVDTIAQAVHEMLRVIIIEEEEKKALPNYLSFLLY